MRPARRVGQAANQVDGIFIPDSPDAVPQVVNALAANGVDLRRVQMIGSGLWEDARISSTAALEGVGTRRPRLPVFAISPLDTARATDRIQYAQQRLPMMRSRSLPLL